MAATTQKVNRVQSQAKTKYMEEKRFQQNVILKIMEMDMKMGAMQKAAREVQRQEQKNNR